MQAVQPLLELDELREPRHAHFVRPPRIDYMAGYGRIYGGTGYKCTIFMAGYGWRYGPEEITSHEFTRKTHYLWHPMPRKARIGRPQNASVRVEALSSATCRTYQDLPVATRAAKRVNVRVSPALGRGKSKLCA